MKTSVIEVGDMLSVLSVLGVEQRIGVCRRYPDAGDPRRGHLAARAPAGAQDPRRQCRRSDGASVGDGASHGLNDRDFDAIFTRSKPIVFAYHGYPSLIHRLTYRRTNHANLHVHGYKEEGTTTTPFDMVVLNEIDRFHLLMDVVKHVPGLAPRATDLTQLVRDKLLEHKRYIERHGEDMPEIRDWRWAGAKHGGTS